MIFAFDLKSLFINHLDSLLGFFDINKHLVMKHKLKILKIIKESNELNLFSQVKTMITKQL